MANLPKAKKPFDNPFAVSLSPVQKETIEKWLSPKVDDMIQSHAERDENIKSWRTVYEAAAFERDKPYENASNLHIPMIGWTVDALHVRIVQSHFGVEPFVRFRPKEAEDKDDAATLDQLLWHVHKTQEKIGAGYMAILDSLVAGFGVIKEPWKQEYRKINEGSKSRYVLKYNAPKAERIKPEDFYIYQAQIADVDSAQIVGHRFWRRWDDLQRGVALGIYNEDWVQDLEAKSESKPPDNESEGQGVSPAGLDWKDYPYELFELIVSYDLDEDGLEEDYLCVWDVNNQKFIRWINYPYAYGERYYHLYTPFPNGEPYGYSLVKTLIDLEHELSTLHNQRIDNNTIVNMPMFTVLEHSPAARDKEPLYPGKKIVVQDHDDIRQLTTVPPRDGFGADEDRIMQYAKLRSGMSDLNQGQFPKGERTAYEVEAALSEGSIKIRLIITMGVRWLARQAWQEIAMLKQFLPEGEFERITNKPNIFDEYEYEDLWGKFDVDPLGNTTTSNPELERQRAIYLREALKGDPLVIETTDPTTGMPVPREKLGRWWEVNRAFLLAHGEADYENYIGSKPEEAPEQPAMAPMGPETPPLPGMEELPIGMPQPPIMGEEQPLTEDDLLNLMGGVQLPGG